MLLVSTLAAAALVVPLELAPGARYDPRIPTLKQVVGHDTGDEITTPEGITAYVTALAAAAPERTRLLEYARTWEGRPLHVLVIASPERIARLDAVKADLGRLADPRKLSAADTDTLVRELPVVTWLLHAVHGNEISGPDAALAEAHHLLAAQGDPAVDTILRESLVLIDPLENPDGRARFVAQNRFARAMSPDVEPLAAERDEPWPGGRTNHYLFDMNRDWFALSQPETRGRVALYLEWYPQVVADLHEMGGEATYYFAPPARPLNPHIPKRQAEWLETFGRANAAAFDGRGFAYFVRELYDSFYPGYGESWPIFQGAVGMTFEQASARGLRYRRRDETVLTYRDGVVHHFTAAMTTALTAAQNRERLLRDFVEYRKSAVAEGGGREYLLLPGTDPGRSERLARLLAQQGIEVRRAEEPVRAGAPAGTFVVSAAQPSGRLVRNLLDPHTPQDDAFVAEQDRRRKKRLPDQIYDVTGWSLPLAFDVECAVAERPVTAKTTAFGTRLSLSIAGASGSAAPASQETAAPAGLPAAKVGYLLDWGTETAGAVAQALQAGIRVRTVGQPFASQGRKHPAGTALVRVSDNGDDLASRLSAALAGHRVTAVPVETGWVDDGISLGSSQVLPLESPRVLLAWDSPAQSLSSGWARYVLERRFGQPTTAVRVGSLRRVDLRSFDVVVLPSGDYTDALNDEAVRRLKDWVRTGGTLVTLAEASRWAAREKVALLETRTELRDGRPDVEPKEGEKEKKDDKEAPKKPLDLEQAIRPDRERPETTPGALLRVALDSEHWLAAGSDGEVQALVEGQRIFTPIKLDKGRNVGVYARGERLVASGLAWEDAREMLASKAYLIHQPLGDGHVIAFAEDPNFRGFTEATELLFINAVLLGPAY